MRQNSNDASAKLPQTVPIYLAFGLMPTCLTLLYLMQWMAFFDTDEVSCFSAAHFSMLATDDILHSHVRWRS